jgi:hypothetical protein
MQNKDNACFVTIWIFVKTFGHSMLHLDCIYASKSQPLLVEPGLLRSMSYHPRLFDNWFWIFIPTLWAKAKELKRFPWHFWRSLDPLCWVILCYEDRWLHSHAMLLKTSKTSQFPEVLAPVLKKEETDSRSRGRTRKTVWTRIWKMDLRE